MKKLICMMLALIVVMSLCACGTNDSVQTEFADTTGGNDAARQHEDELPETTEPAVPTSEEKELLETYVRTVSSLNREAAKLKENPYCSPEAIQEKRTELLALDMDAVSKWARTEWAEWAYDRCGSPENFVFPADFDCEAVLGRFVKVEDVKIRYTKTAADSLGNVSGPYEAAAWHYFANGAVRQFENEFHTYPMAIEWINAVDSSFDYDSKDGQIREYDTDGRLNRISYYSGSNVSAVRFFEYDARGNLTTQTAMTNFNERVYHYSYDAQGRLEKTECVFEVGFAPCTCQALYTYDANGNLVKEVITKYYRGLSEADIVDRYITEYAYDASGEPVSGTFTKQEWVVGEICYQTVDRYTYERDTQGRVIKETVILGDKMNAKTNTVYNYSQYDRLVYETVYGDYYVYTPAE